jgi:aryl sulfotransferase
VPDELTHYSSPDEDSSRWTDFPLRDGDIVISARSKTGTTWLQMICALLVIQTPELPDSLANISPWLDWLGTSRSDVYARLASQDHRRFIKTHTPLDGLPVVDQVTYLVTGRHPLDMAVSLYYQGGNLNRTRIRELTGQPGSQLIGDQRAPLHEWLVGWIEDDVEPKESLDSLPGVLWHLTDAWNRRPIQRVVLVHYDDLVRNLGGEMRRIADRLGISVREDIWPGLVEAATFARMRASAASTAPNPSGILKDPEAFFRRGHSGAGAEALSRIELDRYYRRASTMAPPDIFKWVHRPV